MEEIKQDFEIISFKVEIARNEFDAILGQIKSRGLSSNPKKSANNRVVEALLDLDLSSGSFLISKIQNHNLPRVLAICPKTETHKNISSAITKEIYKKGTSTLVKQLKNIVNASNEVSSKTMHIRMGDLSIVDPSNVKYSGRAETPIIATLAPTIYLDFDDKPQFPIARDKTFNSELFLEQIARNLKLFDSPKILVDKNTFTLTLKLAVPNLLNSTSYEVYAHWGSYEEFSTPWSDELLIRIDETNANCIHHLSFSGEALIKGAYGITLFIKVPGAANIRWFAPQKNGDIKFFIECDDIHLHNKRLKHYKKTKINFQDRIKKAIFNSKKFISLIEEVKQSKPLIALGECLSNELNKNKNENQSLKNFLNLIENNFNTEDIKEHILTNYGLGEVVFITPEGPHAGAGGLAQVISGLPPTIAKHNIPTTIISPLYAYENGNKHPSANDILAKGIILGDVRVIPEYVGTVRVDIGPTYIVGSANHGRAPSSLNCKVYLAQYKNLRFFLIANSGSFDRLYEPVYSDEQLRRALVFSRASLEVIAKESLLIKPSVIISNDWMAAIVPSLCALDYQYQKVDWLKRAKTIHMIHNGGADYHGRLPLHYGEEDLWPMFNLAPEHYFGFQDPYCSQLLNLTMGATQHVSGGILTVSQPYAKDLLSDIGSDGLHYVLQHKREKVFGVSNGINREHINSYLSFKSFNNSNTLNSIDDLLVAKTNLKNIIQTKYRLSNNQDAKILCMVGRLVEQKGLHLLSGHVAGTNHSTLEEILVRYKNAQIIVAGPVTLGDESSCYFCDTVRYLQSKYPGRIGAEFSYLSHSSALDIIAASSLFLMPSRFEPGGIAQLEALAVGTPVIGRAVGGISSTIINFNEYSKIGNGFLCYDYNPTAFASTVMWALKTCSDNDVYNSLVAQAYNADHSWEHRSAQYISVLQAIILGEKRIANLSPLKPKRILANQSRANN